MLDTKRNLFKKCPLASQIRILDSDFVFSKKILYLAKLCYYYAPPKPHRKWLCYFVPYGHGKLDLRFVHGRIEKCI